MLIEVSLVCPTSDLKKLQKNESEKLVFSLHIKHLTSSVTRPKLSFFLLLIDFYLYYKYNVAVISFMYQIQ